MDVLLSFLGWLETHRELGGLVYILVFAGVMTVGIPGGNLLLFSAGFLFGFINGTIFASTAAVLSAVLVYGLMRTTMGNWLDHKAGKTARIRAYIERGNWQVLVLIRLIPVIPFFAVNIAMTAIGIPRRLYILTTIAGMIPITAIFAWIGSSFRTLDELSTASLGKLMLSAQMLVPLVLLFMLISVASLLLRKLQRTD